MFRECGITVSMDGIRITVEADLTWASTKQEEGPNKRVVLTTSEEDRHVELQLFIDGLSASLVHYIFSADTESERVKCLLQSDTIETVSEQNIIDCDEIDVKTFDITMSSEAQRDIVDEVANVAPKDKRQVLVDYMYTHANTKNDIIAYHAKHILSDL